MQTKLDCQHSGQENHRYNHRTEPGRSEVLRCSKTIRKMSGKIEYRLFSAQKIRIKIS